MASAFFNAFVGILTVMYRKAFFRIFVLMILLLLMIYAILSAKHQSNRIKTKEFDTKSLTVKLVLHDQEISQHLSKNRFKLIGITENFSFFYSQDSNYMHIVPNSNISELVLMSDDDKKKNKKKSQNLQDSNNVDSIPPVDSLLNSTSQ